MAGPAIRALELASALSAHVEVELVAPSGSSLPDGYAVSLKSYDPRRPRSLARVLNHRGAVIAPPLAPGLATAIVRSGAAWIADLVNPEPFEGLEFGSGLSPSRRRAHETLRADRLAFATRSAAAFICANERQRDMWLGFLAAQRRLTGLQYESDRTLERLIQIVPSGIPSSPPVASGRPVLRGVHVAKDALLAIWNGGLWDWLDPLTVIEAIAILRADDRRWALAFLGTDRPGGTRHMTMHHRARELAEARGLLAERAIHFEPGWTSYAERGAPLLEANVGVCAHPLSAETRFSARTRMLDLVWARVPLVSSAGDEWSERIAAERLGAVAPPGDPGAHAKALQATVAAAADCRRRLDDIAPSWSWDEVSRPLPGLIQAVAGRRARPGPAGRALALRHRAASAIAAGRGR